MSRGWRQLSIPSGRTADTALGRRPSRAWLVSSSVARRYRASTVFNAVVLVIGVIGLVFVVRHLGWAGIRQAVIGTGGWFLVIAAIDLASAMCDAFAIHGLVSASRRVSYWRVFAAQISGMAINRLTPGNTLGEPVKVTLLIRTVPVETAVSGIVMFNLITLYVGIAAIVIGVPVTVLLLDLPDRVQLAVWIAMAVLLAVATAIAIVVRRGALGTLISAIERVRMISASRAESWRAKVAPIDARVRSIGDTRTSGSGRGLAGVLASRALNGLGTIVVLHAADIPMTGPLVIASLTVGIVITWMSNIIPLGLGIADGTNYVLYGLLGAAPVSGLLFTMVNRLRTIVLAMIGLTVLGVANSLHRRNHAGL